MRSAAERTLSKLLAVESPELCGLAMVEHERGRCALCCARDKRRRWRVLRLVGAASEWSAPLCVACVRGLVVRKAKADRAAGVCGSCAGRGRRLTSGYEFTQRQRERGKTGRPTREEREDVLRVRMWALCMGCGGTGKLAKGRYRP